MLVLIFQGGGGCNPIDYFALFGHTLTRLIYSYVITFCYVIQLYYIVGGWILLPYYLFFLPFHFVPTSHKNAYLVHRIVFVWFSVGHSPLTLFFCDYLRYRSHRWSHRWHCRQKFFQPHIVSQHVALDHPGLSCSPLLVLATSGPRTPEQRFSSVEFFSPWLLPC